MEHSLEIETRHKVKYNRPKAERTRQCIRNWYMEESNKL